MLRSTQHTSKRPKLTNKRRDPARKVKKTIELLEKYYTEEMGREVPKESVTLAKITKQKDEKELFKLTDLVVGAALLGKNKENVKKAISKA